MMRYTVALLALWAIGSTVYAQAPGTSSTWGSVYVSGGSFVVADAPLFRNDMRLLAPGSSLLEQDLSGYKFTNDRYEVGTGCFEATIGLQPFKREVGSGPELRLGVSYAGLVNQRAALRRTTRLPYDTLTSSQTGQQSFVDSVYRDNIRLDHHAERIGVNASLTWRTHGRWSVYGGFGIAGGPVLNARTELRRNATSGVEPRSSSDNDGYFGYYSYAADDVETFRNGAGWWVSTYLPLGLDLQIARSGTFFSRLHLFYEVRPQMVFHGSAELGSTTSFGAQSLFGLRLKL